MTESGRRAVTSAKVKLFSIYPPYDRIVFNRSPVDARMLFSFLVVRPWTNACFFVLGCSSMDARVFFSFLVVRPWALACFFHFRLFVRGRTVFFQLILLVPNRVRKHFYQGKSVAVSFLFYNFAIVNYKCILLTDRKIRTCSF